MRRAGTHFLRDSLFNNFYLKWADPKIMHPVPDSSVVLDLKKNYNCILIIRDPIHNLISLYRFFKQSKNKAYWKDIDNRSFSEWLAGKTIVSDKLPDRWIKSCFEDPIKHWVDMSYLVDFNFYTVKYEDLRDNFNETLEKIEADLGWERKYVHFHKSEKNNAPKGTGPMVSWSYEDLLRLHIIAGERLKQLNYGDI